MSLVVIAVSFGIVFVAELPDKTMIASIVLASRYPPLPVWIGTASAMVVNTAIAIAAGRLLQLLPHRVVEIVVAVLFAAGALYLLLTNEEKEEREGEETAEQLRSAHRISLAAFGVIVLAELGDITQVLTANLAAHYGKPWSVFVGAGAALVAVTTIGVVGGRALIRVLPLGAIRKGAGVLLAGFAVYSVVAAVRA
ncbi:MAG TPA: TMEM165/GDT1 family protein [Acidimicrobiales bacterium]|nr:TMEM165/GDT1 family protein [Acidimicrobiales bacterium]